MRKTMYLWQEKSVWLVLAWSIGVGLLVAVAPPTAEAAPPEHGAETGQGRPFPVGICPPFHLRDEDGNVIDPVKGENADRPYSPRMTCGACHDYEKITQGYHFMQGKGEEPTPDQAARYGWVTSPGNFGGAWCSPAPLYRYLAPKKNNEAATIDMTAFDFFTSPCGACHPGGGPAEHDRAGNRYDRWMADPASGFSPGADNDLDGDYYKARWSETGVLEADCLLCHMPGYDFRQRQSQLGAWNFRWAATAGAKLAVVTGSVKDGVPVEVNYDAKQFKADGTLELAMVREPRNEACLNCHAQPGWKKRGTNFRARTDVHLRAGMRCVDCHPAASSATDPRIAGHEVHQVGKGDDPGGQVRNDLDDTMIGCADCHDTGRQGAPIARHLWLPPLHMESIACQTCHIPEHLVMPVEAQISDVYNPAPRIKSPGKKLWTFYGPDWKYRNHYGYLEMMGYDDKPTERFRPKLVRYKGKIYPANRIHSAWPGIEIEGQSALMQPRMGDILKMWREHQADPAKYPELAKIVDDNDDGVPEVNRPEEIDALIASVALLLTDLGYPMEGKRVVWVMDDRVYGSGTEYRKVEKHEWEASPFANVHKYSHDVYPAKAALGASGCTDCHHPASEFFYAPVLTHLFDEKGSPVVQPQYAVLGLKWSEVTLTACCQAYLKPNLYGLIIVFGLALVALVGGWAVKWVFGSRPIPMVARFIPPVLAAVMGIGALLLVGDPETMEYMLPTRFWLDANHFFVAAAISIAGLVAMLWELRLWISDHGENRSLLGSLTAVVLALGLAVTCATGILIFLKIPGLEPVTRVSYSLFEAGIFVVLLGTIVSALHRVKRQFGENPKPAATA